MDPNPIEAYECSACGEIFLGSFEDAEECCMDMDTQDNVYPRSDSKMDEGPILRVVK